MTLSSAKHIVKLADQLSGYTGLRETQICSRVFDDSNKIRRIRDGADLTIESYNRALAWFAKFWPQKLKWPDDIVRPEVEEREPLAKAAK